jgi:hypothetical protein
MSDISRIIGDNHVMIGYNSTDCSGEAIFNSTTSLNCIEQPPVGSFSAFVTSAAMPQFSTFAAFSHPFSFAAMVLFMAIMLSF